ncbi:MAG: NUDIX hydrolase [Candidatus Promineifilaceae bacterium]|nr:NUDIX hydrolase [Candidatus Promineifilaceae bacterium]
MEPWKTVSRRRVLEQPPFLIVENHVVELPDGETVSNWQWVITPDFVNVLLQTEDEDFLVFRQVKYGIEGTSLAPVGGYIDEGEAPLASAQRELLEETGYEAAEWVALGSFRVDANRGAGVAHLFLARGGRKVAEPNADDLEEQQLLRLSREELEAAVAEGGFKALPWVTNVVLGLRYLDGVGGA